MTCVMRPATPIQGSVRLLRDTTSAWSLGGPRRLYATVCSPDREGHSLHRPGPPTPLRSTSPASEEERRAFRRFRFAEPEASVIQTGRWRAPTPPTPDAHITSPSPAPSLDDESPHSPSRVEEVTQPAESAPQAVNSAPRAVQPASPVRPPPRARAALALLTAVMIPGQTEGFEVGRARPKVQMDLPLLGQPARFGSEFTLPVPPGHVWARYDVICLHEHSGNFRDS